jgi:Spy/CpxP family protein refolding chaperone
MKKKAIVLGIVGMMLLGVTYAFAQGPGPGPGPGMMAWRYHKGITLTPDQRTTLQELRRKFNTETAQLRGSILAKRLELQGLWSDPKSDPKSILERSRELRGLQDQLKDKAMQMRIEARGILTPEQLAQVAQFRRRGHGFGPGGKMGPGAMRGFGPEAGRFGGMW